MMKYEQLLLWVSSIMYYLYYYLIASVYICALFLSPNE